MKDYKQLIKLVGRNPFLNQVIFEYTLLRWFSTLRMKGRNPFLNQVIFELLDKVNVIYCIPRHVAIPS